MADDIKFVIGVDDRDLIKAQKEQLKFQRNLITIEQAYRKGDITAKRYNQELNKQTKELQRLGGSYRTASSEVRSFAYQLRQADEATLAQSQAMAFAGKRVNRLGVGLQQAGYQIGDFAVQVQGGTNAAVALGQQGSQLLGIFGPAGALAGAALAIGTAIVAPLMKANKEAKSLIATIEGFTESYQTKLDMLKFGVDTEEEAKAQAELLELRKTDLDLRRQIAQTDSLSTRQRLSEELRANSLILSETRAVVEANKEKREQYELAVALSQSEVQEAENLRANQQRVNRERVEGEKEVAKWQAGAVEGLAKRSKFMEYYNKLLDEQIEKEKQAAEARSKIAFPDLGMSDAMLAIAYQEYGQSRADAPDTPPKPKSSPKEKTIKDPLAELNKRIALDKELLGVSEARAEVLRTIANSDMKYTPKAIEGAIQKLDAYHKEKKALDDIKASQQELADVIGSSMEDSFMSIIDGTSSVKDAFRNMARDIIAHLFKVLVIQRAIQGIGGAIGGDFGAALQSYGTRASGGTVMANQPYLVGEKGPEIIMPQNRGHVMNADLTAKAMGEGKGSGDVTIIQNNTFGGGVTRAEVNAMLPKMVEATKAAVVDAKLRGGSYGGAFA